MNGLKALIGFFGFGLKGRMNNVEKRQNDFKDSVQFKDVCQALHGGLDTRLDDFSKMQTEIRNDIKKLLAR